MVLADLKQEDEMLQLHAELETLELTVQRLAWKQDPVLWARQRLGVDPWSKQQEVLYSIRDNRRTAVRSCHEAGKSFIAATAVAWWLDVHDVGEAFVVTSAPTGRQVRAILWREIGRCHAKGKLLGRVNQTEWFMTSVEGNEELVAFGQKPADFDPSAFQGIHARYVLVVFDESGGMPMALWAPSDSLIANDLSRRLDIGNPDDPNSEFARVCKPGSGWNVVGISAFDTPNFTGEPVDDRVRDVLVGRTWVEEKRRAWAPHWAWDPSGTRCLPPEGEHVEDRNPLWCSKILGEFPVVAGDSALIPVHLIEAAQQRFTSATEAGAMDVLEAGPNELGVDVGGGGDSSTTAHRMGVVVRITSEDRNPDTMETCGKVVEERKRLRATQVKVDVVGIGRGLVDRGKELNEPFVGINVGNSPTCNCTVRNKEHEDSCNTMRFVNLRAQAWWEVRERFESGAVAIDPLDDRLSGELAEIRYKRTSRGQIQIESKLDAKRRGIPSPNRADGLMLSFLPIPEEARAAKQAGVLW